MNYQMRRAENLYDFDPQEGIILDVRTDMEHAEKRLASRHAHVPLDKLQPTDFMMRHGFDKDAGVYILCRSGKRATHAAEQFAAEGYSNIHVIEGGIIACEEQGHGIEGDMVPVTAAAAPGPTQNIAPERIMLLATGIIIVAGAALAFVHPIFAAIPLIAGAVLVFSSLTNRGKSASTPAAPLAATTKGPSCS